jgi:hypothetical protein
MRAEAIAGLYWPAAFRAKAACLTLHGTPARGDLLFQVIIWDWRHGIAILTG